SWTCATNQSARAGHQCQAPGNLAAADNYQPGACQNPGRGPASTVRQRPQPRARPEPAGTESRAPRLSGQYTAGLIAWYEARLAYASRKGHSDVQPLPRAPLLSGIQKYH